MARSILPIFSSLTEEGEPSAGKSRGQVLEEVRQAYFSAWSLKTSRYSGKTCPPLWCPVEWAVFKRFGPWGPKSHPLFGEDALEMEDMDGVEVTRHRKKRREHFKLPDLEKSTRTIESGDGIHGLEGMSSRSNIQQNHMRELIEATKRQASVQESIFLLNALSTGLITDADTKVLVNQHLTHAVDEILQNEENRAKIARNSSRKDGRRGGTSISTIPLGELMDS